MTPEEKILAGTRSERIAPSDPGDSPTAEPRRKANGKTPDDQPPRPPRPALMDWADLEGREPPIREWIVPHWVPAGHTTLLAGRGGVGKTLFAQHLASALALGHEYLEALEPRRVLFWAGEDDEAELWRRQVEISRWMGQPLSALRERFFLRSYAGQDVTLLAPIFGEPLPTPMLTDLREQVRDTKAELVILDNIARLCGVNENSRHDVSTFCALVQGACAPAAVLLLGHPAKAAGSEFSGSTAWEGAVRARLYLGDRPPDQDDKDDLPVDDSVRYLCRRKANYSALDLRRFTLSNGVLAPDHIEKARMLQPVGEFTKDVVRRAVRKLAASDLYGTASTASPNYLPKLAKQYGLLETVTEKSFASAMRQMVLARELVNREVGRTADRHPKSGLVLL
jgi:hypothetical protein